MKKVYVFLADGFETVEALAVVDILRRASIEAVTVAVSDSKKIISAQVNWKTTKASFKKLLKTKLLFTPVKAVENKYSKIKIKRYDLNEYKLSVVMALP